MDHIKFDANIRNSIHLELSNYPLHQRGNPLAKRCINEAQAIIVSTGLTKLNSPSELFVLGSKIRSMLKFARSAQKWDYATLSVERDDEERGGDDLYRALDQLAKAIDRVSRRGQLSDESVIADATIPEFCRSLLWLVSMGLNLNHDLYNDYFHVRK